MNARKSTLHGRNFYMDAGSLAIKRGVPGPGTYEDQQTLDPEGVYTSSLMG